MKTKLLYGVLLISFFLAFVESPVMAQVADPNKHEEQQVHKTAQENLDNLQFLFLRWGPLILVAFGVSTTVLLIIISKQLSTMNGELKAMNSQFKKKT